MEEHIVKVQRVEPVTHDVLHIVTDKPKDYSFTPGQATEVAINKEEWKEENRPFTFTSLPDDDHLAFTIKTYPSHNGVTNELRQLKANDELIIHDVWGAIAYKGEGVFIAGGAGVTPFIAIFKDLEAKGKIGGNKLVFANKTKADIILEDQFKAWLGNSFINILSDEGTEGYHYGVITKAFLQETVSDFNVPFYVCGPPPMMDAVLPQLEELGVDKGAVTVEV